MSHSVGTSQGVLNGIDLLPISRIENLLEEFGQSFVDRIYTNDEAEYCRSQADSPQHFAVRWAAKEATIKALPVGQTIVSRDIEIRRDASGPTLNLRATASDALDGYGSRKSSVSLSHDRTLDTAIAEVMIITDS